MAYAYIGLGSNLGDRMLHLHEAARALTQHDPALKTSHIYESTALAHDTAAHPAYLNAVIRMETPLTPELLLRTLHKIEATLGRERRERWADRTIDLDLLLYGPSPEAQECAQTPELELPHPHLHTRPFVLQPLAELMPPSWKHPRLGLSLSRLLEKLADFQGPGMVCACYGSFSLA